MPQAKCIYCPRLFDPEAGQGDHVLPSRLFGEFEGDKNFRGCCPSCNNRLGTNEQLLSQGSPLGLYRSYVKPNLGKRRNRGGIRLNGVKGARRPKFTMTLNGRSVEVSPLDSSPLDCEFVDQLVLGDAEGAEHYVRLYPNMKLDELTAAIQRQTVAEVTSCRIECDETLTELAKDLVSKLFPSMSIQEEGVLEPGEFNRVPGRIEFSFSVGYFQALAKIAFHYYLLHNRREFSGHEDVFDELKSFILDGGEHEKFFHSSGKPFNVPLGEQADGTLKCPKHWHNFLAANEHCNTIVIYMHFFVGPGNVPPPIYITLGSLVGRPRLPVAVGAFWHSYEYDLSRTDRYAGTVVKREVFDMRQGTL